MKKLSLFTTALITLAAGVAHADDRALLISVSQYQDGSVLPGIDKDPALMRDITSRLGFSDTQTRVLRDKAATKNGILNAIQSWLVQGVGSDDRVIMYFSGHGYRVPDLNGDEVDGCDEALVPYDADHLLIDDELNTALSQIPARNVLVVIDACFSGTATKSAITGRGANRKDIIAKVWQKAMVCDYAINIVKSGGGVAQKTSVADLPQQGPTRWTEFTAAAENQVALTYEKGSFFTLALHQTVMNAKGPITFGQVREYAAQYIRDRLASLGEKNFLAHTPQLQGPASVLSSDFLQFGRTGQVEPRPAVGSDTILSGRSLLDRYLNTGRFKVEVHSNKTLFKLGEDIVYKVYTSGDGYLNLLELDEQGRVAVLFPNRFNQSNRVVGGNVYTMPSAQLGPFKIIASEPLGKTRVVALVTSDPLNLYQAAGAVDGDFRVLLSAEHLQQLAQQLTRNGVVPLPTGNRYGASSVDIEVRP